MCFGGGAPSTPAPNVPSYGLNESEKGVTFEQTKPDGTKITAPAQSEQKPDALLTGSGLNVKGM